FSSPYPDLQRMAGAGRESPLPFPPCGATCLLCPCAGGQISARPQDFHKRIFHPLLFPGDEPVCLRGIFPLYPGAPARCLGKSAPGHGVTPVAKAVISGLPFCLFSVVVLFCEP